MRLHFLQHVEFEDLAYIKIWARNRGVVVTKTALYGDESLPSPEELDVLVIMGGPMGVYDEDKFSWIKAEKRFIEKVMTNNKPVLGICLGAQLIADVCGAKVYQNEYKEIGFFDISRVESDEKYSLFSSIPDKFKPFHWHGDTFEIPEGAKHLAFSHACKNQAFQINDRILGLQFHLESTPQSVEKLIENCSDELINAPYIQSVHQMAGYLPILTEINPIMDDIMDNLVELCR